MDLNDMGQLHAFLMRYRCIESRPRSRNLRRNESELASILIESGTEGLEQMNRFLAAQGLDLIEFTDTDMPGITTGGRVWVLARSLEAAPPAYFSIEQVMGRMKLRDDSREVAAVWYLHIWLIHLALLYSHKGRAVSAVSGYLDSAFEKETLIQCVRDHIERVRGVGLETGAEQRVYQILTDERGTDIPKRVRMFLGLMVDSGLLSRADSGVYEQTLLGAVEIRQNFSRTLQHILPDEDALSNIVNLSAPVAEKGEEEEAGMKETE
ncbi:hypothetical protein Noc_0706 [Nitrosococcus oceani ATCC 19707]|uniref:Uncharacterized protein n=2 Tax=Nitrosococcus oceani TaxID=1229 RepID=Q3JD76_NITOC|nr:hypothetical protein [Nitrosococcus oceani]ABA57220.1 hypothetical protein Noc_0706 [Nitrosococcus oceani ATCC 19707]KFI20354.1 hypothetical protein IB75_03550 [Nitrosococcus oceani C-27]GEM21658.1 hypothetical protein NONS58_31070 [Nitrosococcus oceani]